MALICGQSNIQDEMEICFLIPENVAEIFPSNNNASFSLTVRSIPGKRLRIIVGRKVVNKIPRNTIDKWPIPGS